MKIGYSLLIFLLAMGIATATLVIVGQGISEVRIMKSLDYSAMLIGESKTKTIAKVNQTITDNLIMQTSCEKGLEFFTGKIETPIGSTRNNIEMIKDGNTTINAENETLSSGDIGLVLRTEKQGQFKCSIEFFATNSTNITFVDEI